MSALVLSSCAIPADLVGKWSGSARLMRSGRDATILCFGCLSIAVITLVIALVSGDFDIAYVVQHTSSALSPGQRFVALWAAPAGSLLVWLWMQTGFIAAAFCTCTEDRAKFCANARVAANLVCVFFLLALMFEINPFADSGTAGSDGAESGLNLHQPLLLVGCAAFAVPFAWSFAWLKWPVAQGPAPLSRQVRCWVVAAWLLLTVGAALAAWSSYKQPGPQVGWLPDFAECLSLTSWPMATGLLYRSRVCRKNTATTNRMVALSLITFSFCILAPVFTGADLPPRLDKLFVILLIHIWALAAILTGRRCCGLKRPETTSQNRCDS
jgi:cytochrome c-type biogenesis protein CcmF